MTVYDNMAFGLKLAKLEKDEIDRRVKHAADILGLTEFLDRKPRALSGGQRQRVAMGRAIVREPQAFLMDEPLSNLDAKLRVQMRSEISRIQDDLNVTTIYVTHDQVEAMTMGDRVSVLKKGELQQVGTPEELFDHPVNLFVAGFIGSPAMNFARAKLEDSSDGLQFDLAGYTLKIPTEVLDQRPGLKTYAERDVIVGIRPQDFEDAGVVGDAREGCRVQANLDLVEAIGTETLLHFKMDAPIVMTEEMKELAEDVGGDHAENLERKAREGVNEFVAQVDPKSKLREGQTAELIVDVTRLHFFDLDTAESIFDQKA
jgi:multiple sugar transport system ATP-binding protein